MLAPPDTPPPAYVNIRRVLGPSPTVSPTNPVPLLACVFAEIPPPPLPHHLKRPPIAHKSPTCPAPPAPQLPAMSTGKLDTAYP